MKITLVLLFSLLIVFSLFVQSAVPSESALDAASVYLRQGESATSLPEIYTIEADSYWIVYLHPRGAPESRNLVVIVNANTAQVVEDERTLLKVYQFERTLSEFNEFQKQTGLTITGIDNKLENGELERAQATSALESLDEQLSEYSENVRDLLAKQAVAFNYAELLRRELEIVVEQEREFEMQKSEVTLNALIDRYNETLTQLTKFIETSEAYRAAIINKTSELGKKSNIPASKYRNSLETSFRVGISDFPTSLVLRSYQQDLTQLQNQEAAANSTLGSFVYRKRKTETDKLVESILPQVEQILSSKAELASCTSINKLETAWREVKSAQQANDFDKVARQVTIAKSETQKITTRYEECNKPIELTKQQDNNIFYYAAAVLLLVAIFLIYKFTQKKKEDNGGSNNSLEQPISNNSLFSK